jgi:hypothetical protein
VKTKTDGTNPAPERLLEVERLLGIAAKLKEQVGKADAVSSWRARVLAELARSDHNVGLLRAAQIQRDAGVEDPDIIYYQIATSAESIAFGRHRTDTELNRIVQAIVGKSAKRPMMSSNSMTPGTGGRSKSKPRSCGNTANPVWPSHCWPIGTPTMNGLNRDAPRSSDRFRKNRESTGS